MCLVRGIRVLIGNKKSQWLMAIAAIKPWHRLPAFYAKAEQ